MKILYVYQYFSTPKGSWGTRVYEYAREWIEKGHEVTVVTSIYSKSDLKAEKFIERREIEGIKLIILNIKIDNKQHPVKRIWTFIQYACLASWFAMREKYDVIIASSGPISVGIPGLLAKNFKKRKFVFEVRDLWPDTAITMGFVKSRMIQRMMYGFEKICYNNSDLIVTLSPGSKKNIEMRYRDYNIISVPNAANIELFQSGIISEKMRLNGLEKHKYAIYTGNIGPVNNSRMLFKAAGILKQKGTHNLKIVLVGDGQEKEILKEEAAEQSLDDHFLVLDLMPKDELVPLIKNSLVSLIPLANKPLLDTSSPNKLFESLAAGVPVIQTTNGWIKQLLDENNCGFTVDADHPEILAEKLEQMADNPGLVKEMGENAKKLAVADFDKKVLAQKMLDGIIGITKQESRE